MNAGTLTVSRWNSSLKLRPSSIGWLNLAAIQLISSIPIAAREPGPKQIMEVVVYE